MDCELTGEMRAHTRSSVRLWHLTLRRRGARCDFARQYGTSIFVAALPAARRLPAIRGFADHFAELTLSSFPSGDGRLVGLVKLARNSPYGRL